MKHVLALCALCALTLALPSCGTLTEHQEAAVIAAIDRMEGAEQLTREEAEALRRVATRDWIGWDRLLEMLLTAGLGVLGVRVWRGPAATREEKLRRLTARASVVDAPVGSA